MQEEEIIHIARSKLHPYTAGFSGIGIGDDAAVIPNSNGTSTLISCDLLTEGIHFLSSRIQPRDLGYKSLAVNVSDIAAMGGTPRQAFVAIALPQRLAETHWVEEFFNGLSACAHEYDISVLGGDTTRSLEHLFVSVTIVGESPSPRVKLRSGARPGDIVAVTGNLGDSAAGLSIILNESSIEGAETNALVHRHYRPRPHVQEGLLLSSSNDVTAMMDLSDGLIKDVERLSKASSVGVSIDVGLLPTSPELQSWCIRESRSPYDVAASGGEDYCLLFTLKPTALNSFANEYLRTIGIPFTVIGTITETCGLRILMAGEPYSLVSSPFSHFSGSD